MKPVREQSAHDATLAKSRRESIGDLPCDDRPFGRLVQDEKLPEGRGLGKGGLSAMAAGRMGFIDLSWRAEKIRMSEPGHWSMILRMKWS
jgi:hypothetical protein